jgi:hypothetical protein
MARDTLKLSAKPMNPGGMNDNSPTEELPAWYETNGLHSQSQQFVERKTGNLLINKFANPVLAIHGDLKDRVFIETTTALYMFINIDDPIPTTPILGDDDAPMLGDDDLPMSE